MPSKMPRTNLVFQCNSGVKTFVILIFIAPAVFMIFVAIISSFFYYRLSFEEAIKGDIFLSLIVAVILISSALFIRWKDNETTPEIVRLYEDEIGISTFTIIPFKKKFTYIPFKEIEVICPGYGVSLAFKYELEDRKLFLNSFDVILKDGTEFSINDADKTNTLEMITHLIVQLGDSWDTIFDEFYRVRHIPEEHFRAFERMLETGKKPYGNKFMDLYKSILLCFYYEKKTGNKIFPECIKIEDDRYDNIWKNVEEFPPSLK